jgi:hypothetical protein
MKRFCLACCLVGALAGGIQLIQAAAPVKVTDALDLNDMVAEAKDKVAQLKEAVASEEAFKKAVEDKSINQNCGVLAVVAQAIAEHDKGKDAGIAAPTLRNVAISLRRVKDMNEAKAGVEKLQSALEGKADPAAMVDHPWNKLTGMHGMMEEINGRGSKIRRALQRPRALEKDAQHGSVIVALSLAMEEDTHEVKKPEEIPQWKTWAKEYRAAMSQTTAAMKAGDAKKAQDAFAVAGKICADCHAKFRHE